MDIIPKTKILLTAILCMLSAVIIHAENEPNIVNQNTPLLYFSFDDCVSFAGASSKDYSEFTPTQLSYAECSEIEMGLPGYLLRGNGFPHSCAPGIGNSLGMCIEGSNNCSYDPGNNASLRVNVRVIPGSNGIGSLDKLTFFEKGPSQFVIAGGSSGLNNYPTQLGIRILRDGNEVYRNIIATSRDWNYTEVELGAFSSFMVTTPTDFLIEFLPFCPVGNAGLMQVWDIDELNIIGGCNNINAGIISTSDNTNICASDASQGVLDFSLGNAFGGTTTWIVTNTNGDIVQITSSSTIDFRSLPAGDYTVNHLAYETGFSGLAVGNNISNFTGCFDLSNDISVSNILVAGGRLISEAGFIDAFICTNDAASNLINTNLTGSLGTFTTYLLVDENDIILESFVGPSYDFSNLVDGEYYIYAASHNGQFFNSVVGFPLSQLSGCFELSTALRVIKEIIEIGTISFNGQNVIDLCGSEGMMLTPTVTGPAATNGRYIVTNAQGRILNIVSNPPIDITNLTEPVVQIRLISFIGRISNLEVDSNISDVTGCFLLSNPITINNDDIAGGTIATVDGETQLSICLNDASQSTFSVSLSGNSGDVSTYIVTDDNGNILDITDDASFDLSGAGVGTCSIYNLTYVTGLTGLAVGNDFTDLSGCFALSNPITVDRISLMSGSLTDGDGNSSSTICSGDGNADVINITVSGTDAPFSIYVVTDADGDILLSQESNNFDFEGQPEGDCLIYNVVSLDALTIQNGTNISSISGCVDVSDFYTVTRLSIAAATIATEGETELSICLNDPMQSNFTVDIAGGIGDESIYIVTDSTDNILEVTADNAFDLSTAGAGSCRIYNVSYTTGTTGIVAGSNPSNFDGCFALSNPIIIDRVDVSAGTIADASGDTEFTICSGDGISDIISVVVTGESAPNSFILITDTVGLILQIPGTDSFDFEGIPDGVCQIYNVASLEAITLSDGLNINDIIGCVDISNTITVTRSAVDGGTLTAADGTDCIGLIIGDTVEDSIAVVLADNIGETSSYVITDALGDIVLLPTDPPFGLDNVIDDSLYIINISYNGMISGLSIGGNLGSVTGCYSLSDSIKVVAQNLSGGTLMTNDGLTAVSACLGDGIDDIIDVTLTGNQGPLSSYVITDDSGDILGLPMDPPFDLTGAGNGVCSIYNISYMMGIEGLMVGGNISNLMGVFDLSNPIIVTRSEVDGGTIMANVGGAGADTIFTICSGDGISDMLNLSAVDTVGTDIQWIVTDTMNNVIEISDDAPQDFEGVAGGTCYIYALASLPGLTGLEVGDNLSGLAGCFDLSNAVTITRNEVSGGSLSLPDGSIADTIIVGDQVTDIIAFALADNIGDTSLWLLTDTSGVISMISDTSDYDFNDFEIGVCQIYNLSYIEDVTGLAVGGNLTDISGCFELSNAVTITKSVISGGTIASVSGEIILTACLSDMEADSLFTTVTGEAGSNLTWLVTDTSGVIREITPDPEFDFSGAGAGICLVWHLSYEDNLMGLTVDENVSDFMGTFNLSNSILINREDIISGTLLTTDGESMVTIMVDDGMADDIDVVAPVVMGADTSIWLITDSDGLILGLPMGPPFDFENAGSGTCQIWYLSYTNPTTGIAVDNNVSDIMGCYELSTPVTVIREGLMGGMLSTSDNLTQVAICAGDGIPDPIDVILTDTTGTLFSWVITNSAGEILDLPMGPPFDLEGAGVGTCLIYHASLASNVMGLAVGSNINNLTGNFNLSNSITVNRSLSEGGMLTTSTGDTEVTVTLEDNFPELIGVSISGTSGDSMTWLITDTLGLIMELPTGPPFNFENAAVGVCQIWNLSYGAGTTGIALGNNVSDIMGCTDLSNPITVTKEALVLNSGMIIFDDGTMTQTICAGDGIDDPLGITLTGNIGPNFNYIVTDTLGDIQGLPPGGGMDTSINLEQAGDGVSRIYHIAYANGISGLTIGQNLSGLMGNFDLSDSLVVIRNGVDGGQIQLLDGTTAVTVMVGDGMPDNVVATLSGADGDSTVWIITNSNNDILDTTDVLPYDFDDSESGNCLIYSLSINGTITGLQIGNNTNDMVGCFDLSNAISVTKIGLTGGMITTADGGTTASVCYNDMVIDSIDVLITGNNGPEEQWVITDDMGVILELPMGPPFDFTSAGVGICNIYNVAFDTGLTGLTIGENINTLMGMFSLSNSITVTRLEAEGGRLFLQNGSVLDSIIVNDMMPDAIEVLLFDTIIGDLNSYLITDLSGNISAIQDSTTFIFETQGGGTCQIWHMSYDNALTGFSVGNNVSDFVGCFDLSNPVTIVKDGVNGGMLMTTDNLTSISVCTGDGIDDFVDFILTDTSGTNQQYILVSQGIILVNQLFPPFNFENFAGGLTEFQFYNIAYENGLSGLDVGQDLVDLMGVFDLSNPIDVTRNFNSVGNISANNASAVSIIIGEGINDSIFVDIPTIVGDTSSLLVFNTDGQILEITNDTLLLFENSTEDTCFINLLAYSFGLEGLEIGNTIDSLDGCYNLSNSVSIFKKRLNAGRLEIVGGDTTATFCVGDGIADILQLSLTDTLGANQTYVVTDSSGLILNVEAEASSINFEGAGEGVCLLYSMVFANGVTGLSTGLSINDINGCFLLSNAIEVTRTSVIGGMVRLPSSLQDTTVCVGDGMADLLSFTTTSNASPYVYVVTDTFNVIDTIITGSTFNFENSPEGVCRVWGVSYTGTFIATNGDTIGVSTLSTECADISGNPITVTKEDCPGIPVINEVTAANMVEILNVGVDTIDITGYQLCNDGNYQAISAGDVNCGDLLLAPGELVVIDLTTFVIDPMDGEMALYIDNNFGSNQSIVDYVQWGTAQHLRTNIAIGAGIWTAGDFVSAFTAPNVLSYDGDGDSSTDWSEDVASLCMINLTDPNGPLEFNYRIYPNPSSELLSVQLMEISLEPIVIEVYDSNSRLLDTRKGTSRYATNIDLQDYNEGIYYVRVTVGKKTKTKKFIVIK